MLRETVCYIDRPGLTLVRGVKALKRGWGGEKNGRTEKRDECEKKRQQVAFTLTLCVSVILSLIFDTFFFLFFAQFMQTTLVCITVILMLQCYSAFGQSVDPQPPPLL